jgi:hypothetical protein
MQYSPALEFLFARRTHCTFRVLTHSRLMYDSLRQAHVHPIGNDRFTNVAESNSAHGTTMSGSQHLSIKHSIRSDNLRAVNIEIVSHAIWCNRVSRKMARFQKNCSLYLQVPITESCGFNLQCQLVI